MTLEELLKALEAAENGAEMVEVVKGLQGEITKKNNEAKNLRERMKTAEGDLTVAKERFDKVTSHVGLKLEEGDDLDEALKALEAKKKETGGDESKELVELRSDMQRMKRDFEKMQKEKDKAAEIATAERGRRIKADKERKLSEALAAEKAVSPHKLVRLLEGSVKVLDDDSLVFVNDDGSEVDLKEGVVAFLKENPEFVVNDQKGGSGSGGSGEGGKGKTYTSAELKAMTPEQINANWKAVEASLSENK